MKTIKTAAGVRRLEDTGDYITLFKLREILAEHRRILINRIISDPNAYLDYKFQRRLTGQPLKSLLTRLADLSAASIDLDKYESILKEFEHQQNIVVSNALFYQEIDEVIYDELNSSQLKLVG
jgi:hypothetical protein